LAVLGFVTWDPGLRITPLMQWLEQSGSQFAYPKMRHGEPVLPGALYTSNLSLSAAFLRSHGGFNEAFRRAAWEDSELHYRLEAHGLRTRYNAQAIAYHHHPTGLGDFLRRSFVTGYELGRARALHPGRIVAAPPPSPAKQRALRLKAPLVTALAFLANRAPSLFASERPFWWLLDYHVGRGLQAWERQSQE
jgi:GT2 family glycosyltransferase